ncbi:MAG: hypothetical protein KUA43_13895 [Hoeflea sp.]|uniref:hypothetical protein n=1 Tax=Hoeflea sp. TaxID=1940281 RepID=UPI001DBCA43B|nr:hypothetical protein [Hoeflea sp.]MBU4531251.1 hypothetical protein [Alphaproteobacteria bacterium]MBU4545686.1 hypothetical protein [Alphaproteobacteria bacterium]MBU4550655.1 hypothetical protein [Alphaproteobacteria bacterium]MBV1724528.1 hypothetical protein [Hoeflea sp.]MBV1760548.1 hypothetical protein [Hoeflea sp.]
MISAWDQSEDQLQASQEEEFGEFFSYEPRLQRPNKPTMADPVRPVVNCLPAVFMNPHENERMRLYQTTISTRNPSIEVRGCNLPFEIKQGDQLVRLRSQQRYEITNIRPNGYGVIKLDLVELGLSQQRP